MSSEAFLALLLSVVVALVFFEFLERKKSQPYHVARALRWMQLRRKDDGKPDQDQSSYPPVEALPDFDWSTTEPIKIRAFKPMYHLTMGLGNVDVSSLIQMDRNYLDRIKIRRELMENHPEVVLGANPRVKPAVDEFYRWLLGEYLPTRYPRMFTLCDVSAASQETVPQTRSDSTITLETKPGELSRTHLKNHATHEIYSLEPPATPLEALRAIGGIIEDDCQFLLPSEDGDGYTLQGLVTCFPNGFDMSQKLGLKLRDIHGPVPHYKEKLEKSMDRFFGKLEVGSFMRRTNWTVSTTPVLFNPRGNHLHDGDAIPDDSSVDPSTAILRSELQVLHRLPLTKALLFSFKTFTYPLQEIKDEGLGEELADAIDGMRDGSAPGIHKYKRAVVWGEKVKAFLRS